MEAILTATYATKNKVRYEGEGALREIYLPKEGSMPKKIKITVEADSSERINSADLPQGSPKSRGVGW